VKTMMSKRTLIIACCVVTGMLSQFSLQPIFSPDGTEPRDRLTQVQNIHLFVAVGSGPDNVILRNALRDTWIQDLKGQNDIRVDYRVFVDPNATSLLDASQEDMVEMPIAGGYQHFAKRAFYQFQYAVEHYNFDYYLRVDDDGYLCTDGLIRELQRNVPHHKFFWGKYFCQEGRRVADENFMLFSRDMIDLFLRMENGFAMGPPSSTFAALFAMWQPFLDLTEVWDDRGRIDAQQSYTTEFMHTKKLTGTPTELKNFCESHIWAHHVKSVDTIRALHAHHTLWNETVFLQARDGLVSNQICHGRVFKNIFSPQKTSLRGGNFPKLLK